MDEQFEFLQLVVARLEAARIPYMLTGSLALAIYALPRMTRDIDLVIDGDERRVVKFARRQAVELGGFSASVITPEDLILSKLPWARTSGSARQEEDVRALLEQTPGLEWTYLAEWGARLELTETITRLRAS